MTTTDRSYYVDVPVDALLLAGDPVYRQVMVDRGKRLAARDGIHGDPDQVIEILSGRLVSSLRLCYDR